MGSKGAVVSRDDEFAAFATARYRALVRTGLLLTGDNGHAEDLAQSALIKTYLAWGRIREPASAEAFARTTLVRLALRSPTPLDQRGRHLADPRGVRDGGRRRAERPGPRRAKGTGEAASRPARGDRAAISR